MSNTMNDINMIEENGKVIAVDGAFAVIETQARSACGHCNVGDSCGTSVLAGLFSKRRNNVRLENHLNLCVGDYAVIGINESVLLTTAIMAYMLPIALMIAFAVVANMAGIGDGINFLFSMLGLFAGMHISNRIMRNKDLQDGTQSQQIVLLRNASEAITSIDYPFNG